MHDFKWAVTVDVTSYEAEFVDDITNKGEVPENAVALFYNEYDARLFAGIKNFARYHGNQ